jgi:hypothetical protein
MKKQPRPRPAPFHAEAMRIASELRVDPSHPGTRRLARAIELTLMETADPVPLKFPCSTDATFDQGRLNSSPALPSADPVQPMTLRIEEPKSISGPGLDEGIVHVSVASDRV